MKNMKISMIVLIALLLLIAGIGVASATVTGYICEQGQSPVSAATVGYPDNINGYPVYVVHEGKTVEFRAHTDPLASYATNVGLDCFLPNKQIAWEYSGFWGANAVSENDMLFTYEISKLPSMTPLIEPYEIDIYGEDLPETIIYYFYILPSSKEIPTITWNKPTDIIYKTPLSSVQLNALATSNGNKVDGSFIYTIDENGNQPINVGYIIKTSGTHTLYAQFTPFDKINYNTATKSVQINVLTPAQAVDQLKSSIKSLVSSGKLKKGQADVLLIALDAVKLSLNAKNNKLATLELKAFIFEVNLDIKNKILSSADGQPLIDQANVILNGIK